MKGAIFCSGTGVREGKLNTVALIGRTGFRNYGVGSPNTKAKGRPYDSHES